MILYNNIFESTIMVKKKRIFMNYNPIPKYFIAQPFSMGLSITKQLKPTVNNENK